MARYLIGTALTLKGVAKKQQPADKFRRLLISQKIPFTERGLDPLMNRIDLELKNPEWDKDRRTTGRPRCKTYRGLSHVDSFAAIEFTFDDGRSL